MVRQTSQRAQAERTECARSVEEHLQAVSIWGMRTSPVRLEEGRAACGGSLVPGLYPGGRKKQKKV